jgi:hypothetical protein
VRTMTQLNDEPHVEVLNPEPQPKSFLTLLAEQQGGAVVRELSREARNLIEQIEMHFQEFRGRVSGSISLNMNFTLENGAYKVMTKYTITPPKAPAAGTIMYLGKDGNLMGHNPNQLAMPFTAV